jgi:hypothetical protein
MSKTSDSAERAPFEMTRQALHFMRIAACMAVVLLIICCVEEWRFPLALAPEARAYQGDYPDALRGGLNGSYAIGHLALLCGFIAGCVGVVLVCCKNRRGLAPLTASAPLIAFGASFLRRGQLIRAWNQSIL